MPQNYNQLSMLYINDSSDDIGFVRSFNLQCDQGAGTVYARLSIYCSYKDKNPVFDYYVQRQPATLKIVAENTLDANGATDRTIVLNNAVCRDYMETYDMTVAEDNMNLYLISIAVQADSATIGETDFPG